MGPRSTSPFIDALVTACQIELKCKDDNDFPPIMILSWPTPFRLDGSGALYDSTMVDSITKGFKKLIDCGVDIKETFRCKSKITKIYYFQIDA